MGRGNLSIFLKSIIVKETSIPSLKLKKTETVNTKLSEMTNLMKSQLRTVESKALNFSSKLILVQVQLELEKDKNRKLVKTVKDLRGMKTKKVRILKSFRSDD